MSSPTLLMNHSLIVCEERIKEWKQVWKAGEEDWIGLDG